MTLQDVRFPVARFSLNPLYFSVALRRHPPTHLGSDLAHCRSAPSAGLTLFHTSASVLLHLASSPPQHCSLTAGERTCKYTLKKGLLCPILLLPSVFPRIRVFSSELVLHIKWPKYWSFSISPSNEYSGLISFRIDWFDLLAVQGILKNQLHIQQSHCWAYTLRKPEGKETRVPQCSSQHCL